MTYLDKLKDPRWQKKRLEIMERDEWKCKICGDRSQTLNVHHLQYFLKTEPWDYDNFLLITVCDSCHGYIHDFVFCEVTENRGVINCFEFLQICPEAFRYVSIISNHEGYWTLWFIDGLIAAMKFEIVGKLISFINEMDCQIYLHSDNQTNYFDYIVPNNSIKSWMETFHKTETT